MSEIKPALTAEEWARLLRKRDPEETDDDVQERIRALVAYHGDHKRYHQAAAAALYGQPFGFTREDVASLRLAARRYGEGSQRQVDLVNLGDRIEALLPPEV